MSGMANGLSKTKSLHHPPMALATNLHESLDCSLIKPQCDEHPPIFGTNKGNYKCSGNNLKMPRKYYVKYL